MTYCFQGSYLILKGAKRLILAVAIPNRSFFGVFSELTPLRETFLHDQGMVEDEKRRLNTANQLTDTKQPRTPAALVFLFYFYFSFFPSVINKAIGGASK